MRNGRRLVVLTADEQTRLRSLATLRALSHPLVARDRLAVWASQQKRLQTAKETGLARFAAHLRRDGARF